MISALPFSQVMRLMWIDAHVATDQTLNRAQISDAFGVSTACAATDVAMFNRLHPGNLAYNHRAKVYHRAALRGPVWPDTHRAAVIEAVTAIRLLRAHPTKE